MEELKAEILKIASDTKVLTQNQLFKLLMVNHVRLTPINYDIINSFLDENGIILTSQQTNEKKYGLVK